MSNSQSTPSPAAAGVMPASAGRMPVLIALGLLYVVWGSTYLAMRFALEGFPPLQMAGIRFVIAGTLMLGFLLARGERLPSLRQWGASAITGTLLLGLGNGCVAVAEQWVASSLAAVMVASMPLFTAIFAGFWGSWPRLREWAGIGLGTFGVVLLNLEGDLRASPIGAALLLLAPLSWALGSVWGRYLPLPKGALASATQMLCGGVLLLFASGLVGDPFPPSPGLQPVLAVGYLILFGSIVSFSAYMFLLRTVTPALATSYAYVNPAIAVLLGVWLGGEQVGMHGIFGMVAIIAAVAVIALRRERTPAE